jgi:hypothetical protein
MRTSKAREKLIKLFPGETVVAFKECWSFKDKTEDIFFIRFGFRKSNSYKDIKTTAMYSEIQGHSFEECFKILDNKEGEKK